MEFATTPSIYLPSELLDNIFSHLTILRDGKRTNSAKTLYNACLASRRLYSIAQPHLFATIELNFTTHQSKLFSRTLQTKPQLARAVKELSIECDSEYFGQELQQFLHQTVPSMPNLGLLRSNHRGCTTKLIQSTLYKEGGGYRMSIPTPVDFGNLRSLEMFADDLIFKYNYILRFRKLEHVCLRSIEVTHSSDEDVALPDDWGWTSQSIKDLVLHVARPAPRTGTSQIRRKSMSALSRSMPYLERLVIEHHGQPSPSQSRCIAAFFIPQLDTTLKRLEIHDGDIGPPFPSMEYLPTPGDDKAVIRSIANSGLEHLTIDAHFFLDGMTDSGLFECFSLPVSLRYLTLRYVVLPHTDLVVEVSKWNHRLVAQQTRHICPNLQHIHLELYISNHRPSGSQEDALQHFKEEFDGLGIVFQCHVPKLKGLDMNTRSVLCTSRS